MLAATSLRCATMLSRRAAVASVAGTNMLQQQRRSYHDNIVEHYENPQNVGSMDKNSDDVGTVSKNVRYLGAGVWGEGNHAGYLYESMSCIFVTK